MFKEKMLKIKAEIGELEGSIGDKVENVKVLIKEDKLEDARAMKAELEADKEKLKELKADLELFEDAENHGTYEGKAGKALEPTAEEPTVRERINAFIRSKGAVAEGLEMNGKDEVKVPFNEIVPTTDGIVKTDTKPVTSEEISYTPQREIKTVIDLKQFATIHSAKKAKGSYPILKKATSRMNSVAELEKNPKLAKPEFDSVDWEVLTYRGAIPLSQESIDDADVDLLALVAENTNEIKVNTTNYAIAETIKKFTAKTVSSLDDLKQIFNVDLDTAYNRALVVSQTFYNWLDTLKDGNGRYLLQDSIISASGKVFSGYPIYVISDDLVGANKAFVGDIKRGILFADRKDLGLRWADNEIYGQYLQAVTRFDVKIADKNAGYFVTYQAPAGGDGA